MASAAERQGARFAGPTVREGVACRPARGNALPHGRACDGAGPALPRPDGGGGGGVPPGARYPPPPRWGLRRFAPRATFPAGYHLTPHVPTQKHTPSAPTPAPTTEPHTPTRGNRR